MAFTVSLLSTVTSGSSSSTLTSGALSAAAGDMVLVFISADNAGTNGAASISSVTDSSGNTYTQRAILNRDPGAANAGTTLGVYSSILTSALTSDTITVNFSPNTTYKVAFFYQIEVGTGKIPTFRFINSGTTGASDNPTYTSSSATSGDLVFGVACHEQSGGWNVDSDTTNGSWTYDTFAWNGHLISGFDYAQTLTVQYKITTGAGTQTFNPAGFLVDANDYAITTVALYEANSEPTYSLGPNTGTYSVTGDDTTLQYSSILALASGTHTVTGTSAGVVYAKAIAGDAGSYGVTGTAAGVILGGAPSGITMPADGGSYSVQGQDATWDRNYAIGAATASYSVVGSTADTRKGQTIAANGGSYSISGTANTFKYGYVVAANANSYSVSGTDNNFLYGKVVAAATAAYSVIGQNMTMSAGQLRFNVLSGAYEVDGTNAGLYPEPAPGTILVGPDPRINFWSSPDGLVQSYPYGYNFAKYVRRSYNVNGNGNLFISTEAGSGIFDSRGHLRVTIVDGSSYVGIYAADGSVNAIVVNVDDEDPDQLFHSSGALRIAQATVDTPGLISPLNGAMLVANIP